MWINNYIRNILFLLFALYYAQGSLYPSGTIISQICLLLIYAISSIYFVKTLYISNKRSLFYIFWTSLLLLNVIGFIFTVDYTNRMQIDMFKGVLVCMLSFYPFYYFAKHDQLKAAHLVVFFLMMLPIVILQFYTNESQILLKSSLNRHKLVNNISYSFVFLMPFVFLIKKQKIISVGLMLILISFIILGAKRGAIICGATGLIFYFYFLIRTFEKGKLIRGFIIAIVAIVGLGSFAYKTYSNNVFLQQRMHSILEGNSSGRDILYTKIFDTWYNSPNILNYIFGYGFAATIKLSGKNYAHNDWLELLSNFGLVGFFLYLGLFYAALKHLRYIKGLTDMRIVMSLIIALWFLTSMFSMWYTTIMGFTQALLLAYLIGGELKLDKKA